MFLFLFMALPSGSVGAQRQSYLNWLRSEGYAQRARSAATKSTSAATPRRFGVSGL